MNRALTVFRMRELDAIVGIQFKLWIFCSSITGIFALSSLVQGLFSIPICTGLATISVAVLGLTYYYRRKPRSLNRLLLLNDLGTFCMVLVVVIMVSYFMFFDPHIRDSLSRIGFIFIIPVPFSLGIAAGFSYGWPRWSVLSKTILSNDISERAAFNLFFASPQTSQSPAYWRGVIMLLVVLPLALLKPLLGAGGGMTIGATLMWLSMGMVATSIGIRRYFFLRQSGNSPIAIIE